MHVLGVVKITRAKPFFEDEISDAYLINPIFKEKASKDADLFLRRHEFIWMAYFMEILLNETLFCIVTIFRANQTTYSYE